MANITNHCYDRFAERVLGITDTTTMKQYLIQNKDIITDSINKMYEHSTFLWTGQVNGDKSSKNYYISGGNIILVLDTGNSTIITLYKVDFGFGETVDKLIAEKLIEEILDLQQKIDEGKEKAVADVEQKKLQLSQIEKDIDLLKQQLFMLEYKRDTLQGEIKVMYNDVEMINKQLESQALKLCNSLEYKKELMKLNGTK